MSREGECKMKNSGLVKQFEKEPGKIHTLIKLGKVVIKTEWSETTPGEFPITEWRSFPLQIPSNGFKKYILGSLPGRVKTGNVEENVETIHLPVYIGEDICDTRLFEDLQNSSSVAKNQAKIPIATVATKACGECSSSGLQTQSLSVLPIWNDGTSIVLELDWYEGDPMEGNINPEWYIQASPRLSVKDGLQKLKRSSKPCSIADKHLCCCMHITPVSLGTHVLGEGDVRSCSSPSKVWSQLWKFDTHEKMLDAIDKLSEAFDHTFT
jgi:hypothetical protein